jgi:MFS family permease
MKSDIDKSKRSNWVILTLACVSLGLSSGLPLSSMPVLFKEISVDLNLDPVQIGLVWGMVSFGSIFLTPLGGLLSDRIGNRRLIIIFSLSAGLVGALRGFSNGFAFLMTTTFLWGLICFSMLPAINSAASSSVARNKQAFSQGLLAVGGGIGLILGSMISATILSPLLGGWRNVFFLYGAISVFISLLWIFVGKDSKREVTRNTQEAVTFKQAFSYLFKLKPLWMISIVFLLYQGCMMGMQGYLPYHLIENGWTTVSSSGILTIFNATGALAVVPFALLSDKLGSRKLYLLLSFIFAAVCLGFMSVITNGIVWILIILAGIFYQMSSALCMTMCIETTKVGSAYTGTALGILISMSLIGRAFAPPIGNSLATVSQSISFPFIFWAAMAVVGAIVLIFVKDTGRNIGKPKKSI